MQDFRASAVKSVALREPEIFFVVSHSFPPKGDWSDSFRRQAIQPDADRITG